MGAHRLLGPRRAAWRCSRLALPTLALVLLFTPSPSQTEELGSAHKGLPVSELKFEGLPEGLESGIRSQLGVAGSRVLIFFGRRAKYYPNVMAQDVERLRLYLARNGYPRARVRAEVEPNENLDRVRVVLHVEPGPAVLLSGFRFEGLPEPLASRTRRPRDIKIGQRFQDELIEDERQALHGDLLDEGYATATVRTAVEPRSSVEVDVVWVAEPGPRYFITEISVGGDASPDLQWLARRTLGLSEGQRYSRLEVRESEESLRLLGLFRQVRVGVSPIDSTALRLDCEVDESDHRDIGVGLVWKQNSEIGTFAEWQSRNLFDRGRGLAVRGEVSTFVLSRNESYRGLLPWVIEARTWWPALTSPRTRGILSLSFEREWELNYRLNRIDVVAGLAIASSLRRSYDVNAAISYVDPREPRAKDGLIPTLNGSWTLNTLDDRFDPTSGSVTSLSGSFTPPGVGNFAEYWKGEGTRTGHVDLPLGVLGAYRFTAGLAQPFGVSEDTLIVNERFYAGGAGSHRGYPRRGLGPYDRESGNPEGGEVLLLSSAELRRRLKGSLHAALFVDAGQVWSKIDQPRADNIRFAIGSGLYLSTLVGAVRVDIAFPTSGVPKHLEAEYQVIRRRDGKRIRFLWHFTIGQPF